MSQVAISGNASGTGTLTIAAPNTNSNFTLTLPQATTTIVGTDATQTLTNKTIQGGAITSGTAVSASGTSIDFTSLPSWIKRITVMFDQVSTNGTSNMQIQLGTSSGIQATSYNSVHSYNGPSNGGAAITTGFGIFHNAAGDNKSGLATFTLFNNNVWTAFGGFANLGTQPGYTFFTSGSKSLGATLDRIRITTVNGTDTFDLGSINILYEG
jgi:hypothetical protein